MDVSAPTKEPEVQDDCAGTEHLDYQHALAARTARSLPAFEAAVRAQEARARTVPFELAMDNRRAVAEKLQARSLAMQERHAALADEFDALRQATLRKGHELEALRMRVDDASQEITGDGVAGRYGEARAHSMGQMDRTLESACDAQAEEEAMLRFMLSRLRDQLRAQRDEMDAMRAEHARVTKEVARLKLSQGDLAQLEAKIHSGIRRFKGCMRIEQKGRDTQLAQRRQLAYESTREAEERRAHEEMMRRRAEEGAISRERAHGRSTAFRSQLVRSLREATHGAAEGADRAMHTLASQLKLEPSEVLGRLLELQAEQARLRTSAEDAEGRCRAMQLELAAAHTEREQYRTMEAQPPAGQPAGQHVATAEDGGGDSVGGDSEVDGMAAQADAPGAQADAMGAQADLQGAQLDAQLAQVAQVERRVRLAEARLTTAQACAAKYEELTRGVSFFCTHVFARLPETAAAIDTVATGTSAPPPPAAVTATFAEDARAKGEAAEAGASREGAGGFDVSTCDDDDDDDAEAAAAEADGLVAQLQRLSRLLNKYALYARTLPADVSIESALYTSSEEMMHARHLANASTSWSRSRTLRGALAAKSTADFLRVKARPSLDMALNDDDDAGSAVGRASQMAGSASLSWLSSPAGAGASPVAGASSAAALDASRRPIESTPPRRRAALAVSANSSMRFNVRVDGGASKQGVAEAAEGAWESSELDADELYSDDINFHHCMQFKVNPIIHERRGIVGFSKTRRRDLSSGTAQWVREAAGESPQRPVAVVRPAERAHSAGAFQLPPRSRVPLSPASSPGATLKR